MKNVIHKPQYVEAERLAIKGECDRLLMSGFYGSAEPQDA